MNVIMDGIILIIQAIILMGQLALSWKIHQQAISRDKGFFVIEKSNYITLPEVKERFERKFDLTNDDGISFYVSGNSDIIVCSAKLIIDGVIQNNLYMPNDVFFTLDERFNTFTQEINLNDSQLNKDYLEIKLELKLKNICGYKYTEIIEMRFTKDADNYISHFWTLTKYNMFFKG